MTEEELAKFYKAYKTVMQMLKDRGYVVEDDQLLKSYTKFREEYDEHRSRTSFRIYALHSDDQTDDIFVFFPEEEKLGVPTIKDVCKCMEDHDVAKSIIVMESEVTAFARRALEKVSGQCRIETFKQAELMINITKHKLVPTHEILSDK